MNQAIDITAKLLATENLTVVKAAVSTASFNVETRQLTLPIFKDMTNEIEQMLVGHEVGHALYTTKDMLESIDDPNFHCYVNVVEDVRIEKLMKRKYPGLKKTMIEGYKQLNQRDFFGISQIEDLDDLNLIDRINLWFKVGIASGVTFSAKENVFVSRAEKTETPAEVIRLAKDIYEFSKKQIEEQKQEQQNRIKEYKKSDDETGSGSDTVKVQSESEQSTTDSEESSVGSGNDEELESITSNSFQENLNESIDTTIEYHYVKLDTDYDPDMIIGYKRILKETEGLINECMCNHYGYAHDDAPLLETEFNNFKLNTSKTVNYLIKEFELKKAATQYKRTQISKSGSLDMKKIWGYQLNDDLFKRIASVQDGKKHGMIFLVDWSGSMSNVIADVIQQVITLSMFCHRAQIPFQVLAFSDSYYTWDHPSSPQFYERLNQRRETFRTSDDLLDNNTGACNLLEFFSDKMSNKDFNEMAKRLYNTYSFSRLRNYGLGGTPLNSALAYMTDYVGKFIRMNAVEKMSFITLTDGAGSGLGVNRQHTYGKKWKQLLTDPVTKITYDFWHSNKPEKQTDVLLKMISDRYNASIVGFYIAGSVGWREISSAVYSNNVGYSDFDEIKKEIRKNGFASFNTYGRDDLFIVPAKSMRIEEVELEVDGKQSSSAIANKFSKMMNGKQVNRMLLNKFVGYIA